MIRIARDSKSKRRPQSAPQLADVPISPHNIGLRRERPCRHIDRFSVSMRPLVALSVVLAFALQAKEPAKPVGQLDDPVWYWQPGPGQPCVELRVLLDGKVIFATRFAVARGSRGQLPESCFRPPITFTFRPARRIVWTGYRDGEFISSANQPIQCDLWMAAAEPTGIFLGVSFSEPDAILMNTLHLVLPTGESRSEIATGLVVTTSPNTGISLIRTQ